MKIEKKVTVQSETGLSKRPANLVFLRLTGLGGRATLLAPSGEGIEWGCEGAPSPNNGPMLMNLGKKEGIVRGTEITVKVEGPEAEMMMGEIEHILSHPSPESDPSGN